VAFGLGPLSNRESGLSAQEHPDPQSARWPDGGGRRLSVADGDWRRFRELRGRARRRFAEESLSLALEITLNDDREAIERERALEALMQGRARERRALFEDFNRTHLPLMLHAMVNRGLLERDELTGLSLELRRALGLIG